MPSTSLALFLLLCMSTHAQITIPLSRDDAFDSIPPADLVNAIFSRWSPRQARPISTLTDFLPSQSTKQRGRRIQSRLQETNRGVLGLNLDEVVGTITGDAVGLVQNIIYDPLFGSNVVKATGERGDSEWYGTLSFGNPPQPIALNFDTGSSDLFLLDPRCSSCQLFNHTAFRPARSKTYHNVSISWSTLYDDGTGASGYISRDSAWITAQSSKSGPMQVQIPDYLFALATRMSSSLGESTPSGIVGLGQDRMSTIPGGATIFSRLISGAQLQRNVLGIRLVKARRSKRTSLVSEGDGGYAFGYVQTQWIAGGALGLTWVTVTSSNYWGIPMPNVQMGLAQVLDAQTPRRAIIDTGTSLIVTSQALAASIHNKIPRSYLSRSSVWIVPCSVTSNRLSKDYASNLFFKLGGRRFGVPIEDLAWKPIASDGVWCVSGVQGGVEDFTILGSMFIKNHYVALRYNDDSTLSVGLGDRTDVSPIL